MSARFRIYARRASRVAAGRFARDEHGAVMVMTIAFALPLAMFLFVTYNTGVTLTTRMRAQNVADAASYSAALWQARFLNYCAYTRRHMVSNYATIALCTAYEGTHEMWNNIYDADDLTITAGSDSGMITDLMEAFHSIFNNVLWPMVKQTREGCDRMNKMLSNSQEAMFLTVGLDTVSAVMEQTVKEARRWKPAGSPGVEFELTRAGTFSSLAVPSILERKKLPLDEVKAYYDSYTKAEAPSIIPMIGRAKLTYGGWFGFSSFDCWDTLLTVSIHVISNEVEMTEQKCRATETIVPFTSWYLWIYICTEIFGNYPIMTPIFADNVDVTYNFLVPFEQAKVYEMKAGVSDGNLEPNSMVVIEARRQPIPYYPHMGLLPEDLLSGQNATVRAFSRAKCYFKGFDENLKNKRYQKPDLNYPFWGAKLAPTYDNTLTRAIMMGYQASGGHLLPRYY
jgi:Flp pilus assembly protein TadG